jgi:hypothetical protein
VPKRHIQDWTKLRPSLCDIKLLEHMWEAGEKFLKEHFPVQSPADSYRFGFHSPGQNS